MRLCRTPTASRRLPTLDRSGRNGSEATPRRRVYSYLKLPTDTFLCAACVYSCMPTVPIPEDVWEQLCEEHPDMASQVVKQLHDTAQKKRQKRLDEENSDDES